MEVTLTAADAADWVYRGEGAANLVLAYTGSSPAFIGKVLRVQKARRGAGADEVTSDGGAMIMSEQERLLWGDVEGLAGCASKEAAGRLFVLHVMAPLLGHEHVDAGVNILVSKEFLVAVEKNVANQRPVWRIDATMINTHCDRALLISDHAVLPLAIPNDDIFVAVEIKPKCGFLPCSEFIPKGNDIKTRVSRFRMHQSLKLHQGKILQLSEYDPLDLFSGSKDRIVRATRALFATPQNNLRVFLNGSIVIGALGDVADKPGFADEQTFRKNETLEDSMERLIQAEHGLRLSTFQELVAETIFSSKILDRLLEAQKLDKFDIEGAIHAYYNIISQPCLICKSYDDVELSNKYTFLHSLTLEESMKIVKEYLIAATVKDCSLMISFRPRRNLERTAEHRTIYLESTKQWFEYKVSFIDLDMKLLKMMNYYYELDRRIVDFSKTAMRK